MFKQGKKPVIMGILNVTPDSFSDGGSYVNIEAAKEQVAKMIAEGATIIDVGGESTRPGAEFIDAKTEIERIVPIIKMIKTNFDVLVSVDTYKTEVAAAAIAVEADMINDVWANKYDGQMLDLVSKHQVYYIAMHNADNNQYENDIIETMINEFKELKDTLITNNYQIERLIFDPGVGFAKDVKQNLEVIKRIDEISILEQPILLGTSRKSMFKIINKEENPRNREIGTAVTTAYGTENNVQIFRVHDVKKQKQALDVAWAIKTGEFDE